VAISGEQPYPGCNRGEAVFGSSPAYSRALDRVDIAIGGGGPRGGGTRSPSLVSHAPSTLLLVAGISARDTHALLPAAPTPPAPSALLPRPAGRGQCVAISGEQPYLGCNRWEAVHWTVGISPRGVGLTGRGNSFPLPCLSRSKHLASRCRHFCEGYPGTSAGTPTPPAPSALLPRPHPGAGSVRGDIRGAAVPGVEPVGHRARLFSRISPYAGPWGYRHWGRRPAGRGNLFPLPCLSRSRHLAPCQPYPARPSAGRLPMHFCRQPPPRPRLRRSAPSPAGRGQCVAISGEQPYPGRNRWATVPGSSPGSPHAVDRGDIAIGGGGPRGGGTCSPSPVSHTPDTLLLASPIPPGLQPAGYPYTPPAPPPLPSPGSLTIRAKSQKEMGAAGELRRQRRGL